jgi:hypothetical protein
VTTDPSTTASSPSGGNAVPPRLTRTAITQVQGSLQPAVRACTQGQAGLATVVTVIGSDGAVRNATISGPFTGSPAGTCILGVVRRARFPAFQAPAQATVPLIFQIVPGR